MEIYSDKAPEYFSSIRHDVIQYIPKGIDDLLEIGAGSGATLDHIKTEGYAKRVVGIELFPIENSLQDSPNIDSFMHANIEEFDPKELNEQFDVIMCNDVLEHLIDPWKVVEKFKPLLKPGGLFIASVPNIREVETLYKIIVNKGFDYKVEGGILDKTHLRFFCKKNLIELFENSGLHVTTIEPSYIKNPLQHKRRMMNRVSLGLFKDLLAVQYIVIATNTF